MKFYIGKNSGRHYEVYLEAYAVNNKQKNLTLYLDCYEVTAEGGEQVTGETVKPYERKLIADNSTKVDAQGNYLEPGAEGGIGEWDFFKNISANVPVKVDELLIGTLMKNRARLMPDGLEPEATNP